MVASVASTLPETGARPDCAVDAAATCDGPVYDSALGSGHIQQEDQSVIAQEAVDGEQTALEVENAQTSTHGSQRRTSQYTRPPIEQLMGRKNARPSNAELNEKIDKIHEESEARLRRVELIERELLEAEEGEPTDESDVQRGAFEQMDPRERARQLMEKYKEERERNAERKRQNMLANAKKNGAVWIQIPIEEDMEYLTSRFGNIGMGGKRRNWVDNSGQGARNERCGFRNEFDENQVAETNEGHQRVVKHVAPTDRSPRRSEDWDQRSAIETENFGCDSRRSPEREVYVNAPDDNAIAEQIAADNGLVGGTQAHSKVELKFGASQEKTVVSEDEYRQTAITDRIDAVSEDEADNSDIEGDMSESGTSEEESSNIDSDDDDDDEEHSDGSEDDEEVEAAEKIDGDAT